MLRHFLSWHECGILSYQQWAQQGCQTIEAVRTAPHLRAQQY